ncbi:40465_t:CDS:2, partial [Gigaspora margarita]
MLNASFYSKNRKEKEKELKTKIEVVYLDIDVLDNGTPFASTKMQKRMIAKNLDTYFTSEEILKCDNETNKLKRDRSGVKKDTVYDLKDANKFVNEILNETLVINREEKSKHLKDEFNKILKKENLECACE